MAEMSGSNSRIQVQGSTAPGARSDAAAQSMGSTAPGGAKRQLEIRHRGRLAQIGIYFGKFLRMFVYQSDWKVLPMAALIAGLVGFALGGGFARNMEGTLTGAFSIVCVCIWNGSFNSIQVICRERGVIKREHRSGMHITSYIAAHMMYQLLLCVLQTVVTLIVLDLVGMRFAGAGMFTPWMAVDAGITMLLVTYASDLLSIWISSLVHTTTTAMTVMPFVLIFQLIFSGGLFSLPKVVDPVIMLTISSPGLKAMASQARINDLPYSAVKGMIGMVDDVEVGGRITVGQVLDVLQDEDVQAVRELRAVTIGNRMTIRQIGEDLLEDEAYSGLRDEPLTGDVTVADAIRALMDQEALDDFLDSEVGTVSTIGETVDLIASDTAVRGLRDEGLVVHMTVGDAIDVIGREETMARIDEKASEAMYEPDYADTSENILHNWIHILIFIVVFALLSVITLEFIDKDKR